MWLHLWSLAGWSALSSLTAGSAIQPGFGQRDAGDSSMDRGLKQTCMARFPQPEHLTASWELVPESYWPSRLGLSEKWSELPRKTSHTWARNKCLWGAHHRGFVVILLFVMQQEILIHSLILQVKTHTSGYLSLLHPHGVSACCWSSNYFILFYFHFTHS